MGPCWHPLYKAKTRTGDTFFEFFLAVDYNAGGTVANYKAALEKIEDMGKLESLVSLELVGELLY